MLADIEAHLQRSDPALVSRFAGYHLPVSAEDLSWTAPASSILLLLGAADLVLHLAYSCTSFATGWPHREPLIAEPLTARYGDMRFVVGAVDPQLPPVGQRCGCWETVNP